MDSPPAPPAPTLPALVGLFARVGALAFGGGVTTHLLAHFTRRGWLAPETFLDAVSWCQNLPGPNATNLSAFLGWRFGGVPGAILATAALVLPGAAVVLLLGEGLAHVNAQELVRGGLAAVAAAAVGLIFGAAWQLGAGARLRGERAVAMVGSAIAVALGVPTPIAIGVAAGLLWWRDAEANHADAA